jgi:predicted Zn-dependent protease
MEKALTVLKLSKPNDKSLPFVGKQSYADVAASKDGVADHSPAARAKVVARAIERAKSETFEASGVFEANGSVTAYASSAGAFAFFPQTTSTFSLTATAKDGSSEGWFEEEREAPQDLNVERVVETAIAKAKLGRGARPLAAGRFTVVLEPAAVGELLLFMSWLGFGAMRFLEGRSYLQGKLGEKKFSDRLTIIDDVGDRRAPGMPFDFEGLPTKKVVLIEKGVAKDLVWDRRTALEAKQKGLGERSSTGHSLQQPNSYGPMARHLVMEGDERASLEDLVKGTKDGLLVSKLHYTNVVNPMDLSITGMTRSGVFKVEKGEVAFPVKNFRFTVSLLDVLNHIEALGRPERATGALFGGRFVVPPLRLAGWNMSSTTEF